MTNQNENPLNQVSEMLLESMKRIQSVNTEELNIEIERAKQLSSSANQFTSLEKAKLAREMYQNRNIPRKVISIDAGQPKQLTEHAQKKSID